MLDWTEAEWQRHERRDPNKSYVEVPRLNRDIRCAIACFAAMPMIIATLVWLGHSNINELMKRRDQTIQAEWQRIGW